VVTEVHPDRIEVVGGNKAPVKGSPRVPAFLRDAGFIRG
jgi:hypothetical protein